MGLFGKKVEVELSAIDSLRIDIKKIVGNDSNILEFLDQYANNKSINQFDNEEELLLFIRTIVNNNKLRNRDFNQIYNEAIIIYKDIKKYGYTFNDTLIHFFENNGLYENGLISLEMMAAFEYIENYFAVMSIISKYDIAINNMDETIRLILSISMLTPNDIELRSMISYFFKTSSFTGDYKTSIDEFISFAKKRAGVYDELDEKYLAKMEVLVKRANEVIERYIKEEDKIKSMSSDLRGLRSNVEKLIATFDESLRHFDERVKSITQKYEDQLDQCYVEKFAALKNDYNDLLQKLVNATEVEARKIAHDAVSQMEKDAASLAKVKASYEENTSLSIEQLNAMKREATEEVRSGLEEIKRMLQGTGITSEEDFKKVSELLKSVGGSKETVVAGPTIIAGDIVAPSAAITSSDQGIKLPEVITSFDRSVVFNKRFKEIMERKKRLEEKGYVFNSVIDDCIYFMLENKPVYLFGPSGSGKNYFVKQLSELFNIPYVNIGYIMEEYELVGGRTANGAYAPSNFYECWRNGYIAFCDELDNGIPQATIKLNGFMDNGEEATYNFPVIGFVDRHPNFRLIAAGNTKGMGATRAHNVRQKLDEAIQQRFKYVKFDYDPKVEKAILKDYPEWMEFINLFRDAISSYWSCQEDDIQGQLTTRDISDIKDYLSHGVFDVDKVLLYEFIEAKDKDYLENLSAYLKSHDDSVGDKSRKLIKRFATLTKEHE